MDCRWKASCRTRKVGKMWKKSTILKYLASILLINLNLSMTFLSGEDLCIAPQPTVGKVSKAKKGPLKATFANWIYACYFVLKLLTQKVKICRQHKICSKAHNWQKNNAPSERVELFFAPDICFKIPWGVYIYVTLSRKYRQLRAHKVWKPHQKVSFLLKE